MKYDEWMRWARAVLREICPIAVASDEVMLDAVSDLRGHYIMLRLFGLDDADARTTTAALMQAGYSDGASDVKAKLAARIDKTKAAIAAMERGGAPGAANTLRQQLAELEAAANRIAGS